MIYLVLPVFALAQDLDHSTTEALANDASSAVGQLSDEVKSERGANANLNAWWAAEKVKVEGLESDIELAEGDQAGLNDANDGLSVDISDLKGVLADLNDQFNAFQAEAHSENEERDQAISSLNLFVDELHAGHAMKMEEKNSVLSTTKGLVGEANEKSEGIEQVNNGIGDKIQGTSANLADMQSMVEINAGHIEELNSQFEGMTNQYTGQIASLDATCDDISHANAGLEADAAHAAGTIDRLKSAVKEIRAELENTPQDLSSSISSIFSSFWNSFNGPAEIEAPAVEAPVIEAPTVEAPTVEAPTIEAPTVEAPTVEEAV